MDKNVKQIEDEGLGAFFEELGSFSKGLAALFEGLGALFEVREQVRAVLGMRGLLL